MYSFMNLACESFSSAIALLLADNLSYSVISTDNIFIKAFAIEAVSKGLNKKPFTPSCT